MSTETEERGLFPFDSRWLALVFFVGLLVWVALLMYWSLPWNWDNKLFPLMVGVLAVFLMLTHIVELAIPSFYDRVLPDFGFLGDEEAEDDDELSERVETTGLTSSRSKSTRQVYELVMIAWVVALPILLYFGGFGLVIPIYTFAFGLFFLRDVPQSLLITVVITGFIWLLFVVILNVQLWDGTLGLFDPFDYIPQPF